MHTIYTSELQVCQLHFLGPKRRWATNWLELIGCMMAHVGKERTQNDGGGWSLMRFLDHALRGGDGVAVLKKKERGVSSHFLEICTVISRNHMRESSHLLSKFCQASPCFGRAFPPTFSMPCNLCIKGWEKPFTPCPRRRRTNSARRACKPPAGAKRAKRRRARIEPAWAENGGVQKRHLLAVSIGLVFLLKFGGRSLMLGGKDNSWHIAEKRRKTYQKTTLHFFRYINMSKRLSALNQCIFRLFKGIHSGLRLR